MDGYHKQAGPFYRSAFETEHNYPGFNDSGEVTQKKWHLVSCALEQLAGILVFASHPISLQPLTADAIKDCSTLTPPDPPPLGPYPSSCHQGQSWRWWKICVAQLIEHCRLAQRPTVSDSRVSLVTLGHQETQRRAPRVKYIMVEVLLGLLHKSNLSTLIS